MAGGCGVIFLVYTKRIDGQDLKEVLLDPITWMLLLLPLVPAAVLEWKSRKNRDAFEAIAEGKG